MRGSVFRAKQQYKPSVRLGAGNCRLFLPFLSFFFIHLSSELLRNHVVLASLDFSRN